MPLSALQRRDRRQWSPPQWPPPGGCGYRAPFCTGPEMRAMERAEELRTLAIDIGGSGIELALLDGAGKMIGERVRVPTPPSPVAPEIVIDTIDPRPPRSDVRPGLGRFSRHGAARPRADRAPSRDRSMGRLRSADRAEPALGQAGARHERCRRAGLRRDQGYGVEMVVTLGTGCGTAIFATAG